MDYSHNFFFFMSDDLFSNAKNVCFVTYLAPKIIGATGFVSQRISLKGKEK